MSFYLDTSVIVPLFVDEPASEPTTNWIAAQGRTLLLADLVATECHSAISRLVRMRDIELSKAEELRAGFSFWAQAATRPVENLPSDVRLAAHLVPQPIPRMLSADAVHIATFLRSGATLVTHDADLQLIATREGVRWECPVAPG